MCGNISDIVKTQVIPAHRHGASYRWKSSSSSFYTGVQLDFVPCVWICSAVGKWDGVSKKWMLPPHTFSGFEFLKRDQISFAMIFFLIWFNNMVVSTFSEIYSIVENRNVAFWSVATEWALSICKVIANTIFTLICQKRKFIHSICSLKQTLFYLHIFL